MKFLLTNDDGWNAPGLNLLESVVADFGDIWIVAPELPMSGISHQITFEQPMKLIEKGPRSFALTGTPADCVRIAITQLDVDFDWIFSGINNGANLGSDIFVSGTFAATREAALHGHRSIALSQHRRKFKQEFDWTQTGPLAHSLLADFIEKSDQYAPRTAINVNFPDNYHLPTGQTASTENGAGKLADTEVINCDLDLSPLPADYRTDDNGQYVYCSKYNERPRKPAGDIESCFGGKITVSVLSFD
jgi:5'-nucleotidase